MNDDLKNGQKSGAESQDNPQPGTEANKDGSSASEEKLPFDEHPKWKAARQAEKAMQEAGFKTPEEFAAAHEKWQEIAELTGDRDITELVSQYDELANSLQNTQTELQRIRQQEEERRLQELEENETSEEKAERLEKELKARQKKERDYYKQLELAKENEKLLKAYDDSVVGLIKDSEVPDEDVEFFSLMMGVNNEFDKVNIRDPQAVRKYANKYIKLIKERDQRVISRFKEGKDHAPNMSSTTDTSTSMTPKEPQNLTEAREFARERMNQFKANMKRV